MNQHETAAVIAGEIRGSLEARKQQSFEEIRNYPTPIAGCDQQFNYLLDQQAAVAHDLSLAVQTICQLAAHSDPLGLLRDLIESLGSLDSPTRQALLSRLRGS